MTTPRNDASQGVGQWDLRDAYRYLSEANAEYHFDVGHGLNASYSKSLTTRFTPGTFLPMRNALRRSQSSKTIPCSVTTPLFMVTVTCSS